MRNYYSIKSTNILKKNKLADDNYIFFMIAPTPY